MRQDERLNELKEDNFDIPIDDDYYGTCDTYEIYNFEDDDEASWDDCNHGHQSEGPRDKPGTDISDGEDDDNDDIISSTFEWFRVKLSTALTRSQRKKSGKTSWKCSSASDVLLCL